ncbi:MAG: quinolinate synthase NadA [Candidatus Zapsychrus exili]|nr:quinolinate synthase NadA [Candidatus Zapsychrus exili]
MLTKNKMTAEELHAKLNNIKIGGYFCNFSLKKCEEFVPIINEINELKKEKNAVILAHTYVGPEIIYGVADYVGDSLGLSKNALETDADIIIFSAVRFMGETAKILNPNKTVLVPSSYDGCDLAESIDAKTVIRLRKENPDYTFVCYVNTTVDVKAECDVCVTSANIYKVIEAIENKKIFFVPDKLMGLNLIEEMKNRGIAKDIKIYNGHCAAHKEYNLVDVLKIKAHHPRVKVVSHPECKPEVCENSDFVGSTTQMLNYVRDTSSESFFVLTECGLASRLMSEFSDKNLVGMCTLCPYMKSNKLEDILKMLKNPESKNIVVIDEEMRLKAKKCVDAMLKYTG